MKIVQPGNSDIIYQAGNIEIFYLIGNIVEKPVFLRIHKIANNAFALNIRIFFLKLINNVLGFLGVTSDQNDIEASFCKGKTKSLPNSVGRTGHNRPAAAPAFEKVC